MTIYQIGDIASFAKGASVPRDRMSTSGDYLYLHYGDLYKGHDLYIDVNCPQKELPLISSREKLRDSQFARNDDIIYILTSETIDDLGKALLLKCPSDRIIVAGTETTILRVERTDLILPAYLNYLAQTEYFKRILRQYITGMKVFRVHPRDIAQIRIDAPSLPKQKAIVALLDVFHKAINLNNRINDYLAALLNASFVECLSDGYNEVKLPEVVEILSGGTPKTKIPDYWDGGTIPFFAPGDASDSVYTLTTEKHITDAGLENCNSSLYPVGTVFLTARGTVGKIAIAGRPMAMNQSCFAFLGKGIPQSIVFQIIRNAIKSLRAKANGATFAALSTRDLAVETVYLPTTASIDLYDASASVWLETIRTNEEESLRLVALRDALLPKLMSGEIDVSQVDITQLNNHLYGC